MKHRTEVYLMYPTMYVSLPGKKLAVIFLMIIYLQF